MQSMQMDEVTQEAMRLTLEERAELAHRLLLSLEDATDSEIETLWNEEAASRLSDLREGRVQGIPADQVFRRAIKQISQ